MKTWTIAFQRNTLTFVDAALARGDEAMDDSRPADCFDRLVRGAAGGGTALHVVCRHGWRRLVDYCMTHYIYVRAAGGVVQEPAGRRLLISRNGRWDLPKGGVEAGETLRQAACREVREETAMHDLSVGRLLVKTYHIYDLYGGWHLKQTSWYAMTVPQPYLIVPQQEEGIAGGEWTAPALCRQRLEQSYATMQAVAKRM